jgi:serine protease AprX
MEGRCMTQTTTAAAPGKDAIRFGIRWDGGRRPGGRLLSLLMLALALAGVNAARAEARSVVVVAEPGRVEVAQRLVERAGGDAGREIELISGFAADVPDRALPRLRRAAAVRLVARDAQMTLSADPTPAQALAASAATMVGGAGLAPLDALGINGAGVGVALIDSGVVPVAGFAGSNRLVYGPDFSKEGHKRWLANLDTFGHGTHLAGIIAGRDPLTGVTGVAPQARLVSVKVAGADGETSLARVLGALDWVRRNAAALNIRVVNLSLGIDEPEGYERDPLAWAAEQMWRSGVVVVAAAGNQGAAAQRLDLPAGDPYVLAVGATDTFGTVDPADDRVAPFSSRDAVRPPDVVAPGTNIVSARVPGSALDREFPQARVGEYYFRGSGTSQAAALVSGVVARLLGARPELTPDQLKVLVMAGAVDLADPRPADGAGRIDAGRSAKLPTPDAEAARQTWKPAVLDPRELHRGHHDIGAGNTEWAGRRWAGRRWAGKWNGRRWAGSSWTNG